MSQGASFLDVTLRRMDAVALLRRTARADRLDVPATTVTRSQRPRRVTSFTGASHGWGKKRVAIPVSAVTDVNDGVWPTLTRNHLQDLSPMGLAEPK